MCYKKNFCQFFVILYFASITLNSLFNSTAAKESHGPGNNSSAVSRCVERLSAAVEKAYANVGLSQEDVVALFQKMGQAGPPPKLIGKWESYGKAKNKLRPLRQPAIEELTRLGPGAVGILLRTESQTLRFAGLHDVFVEAVVKMGRLAVPTLINELSDTELQTRVHAATVLGRIGDAAAVEPLIRTLSDPDRRVVRAAVWSLGLLKDTKATESLLDLWQKQDISDKPMIASALGQIGDKRASAPIMAALEECVSQAQQTGNWDMNSWAMRVYAGALGQIGDPGAVPLLKKMLIAGPQKTKASKPLYFVAEEAAKALRSLGLEVTGDREKGGYKVIEVASLAEIKGNVKKGIIREGRGYQKAAEMPPPVERWKVKKYGYGGNPRTWQTLQTDAKGQCPILLTWPLRKEASKYVVQLKGVRGSRPAMIFESVANFLCLEESDIAPGRYQWSVSVYDKQGKFMGDIETTASVEIFSIEDPQPVAANGKRVMIDLNHSAGNMRGWGYYNHTQYMTRELLENTGFEVEVNKRDLLTAARLRGVDLLICHYYWTGWPGFRPYLKSELSAVRKFIKKGGSLLVVGCDRKDGGNMSKAGNQLVEEFGLMFELGEISKQNGLAELESDQNIISFSKPVPVQLSVGVRGQDAITLLQLDGLPIVKAKQFGRGKVIVAGVGMSFLDCYLGDFEHREPLHLIMFYDFIRYLTDIDWKKNCKQDFIETILSRAQFQDKKAISIVSQPQSLKEPEIAKEAAQALYSMIVEVTGNKDKYRYLNSQKDLYQAVQGIVNQHRVFGDPENSVQYFYRLIENDPKSDVAFWAKVILTITYIRTGRNTDAQTLINRLFAISDGNRTKAAGAYILAGEYQDIYRRDKAKRLFQYFVENDPNHPDTREALVQIAYAQVITGDYNDAENTAMELIAKYPDHEDTANFVYTIASRFRRAKQFEKALPLLNLVITNYPDDSYCYYAWMERALIGLYMSDDLMFEHVISRFKSELPANPTIAKPLRTLADQCALRQKTQKAQELYQYIIDHSQDDKEVMQSRMGQTMLSIGWNDEVAAQAAFAALVADLTKRPERAQLLHALGDKCEEFEYSDYAETAYRKLIELDPNSDEAAVTQGAIGWTCMQRGLYDQAIIEYRRVVENYPESRWASNGQYWVAQAYYKKGDFNQALIEYQKVIDKYPKSNEATYAYTKIATIERRMKKAG